MPAATKPKSKSTHMQDTAKALREFDRAAAKMRREIAEVRRQGVGILPPALINKHLKNGQDVVLAYGRQGLTQTYTLADLKRFADAMRGAVDKFQANVRGVPLLQLESASLPIDKERARQVKNARLYKIDGNLLYFRVTGVQQAYYQVRIRMEDWQTLVYRVHASAQSVAKMAAMGKLSIDCQCGRHQYWYRYLANIGGYDVTPPKEQGFPKIRNPSLTGCCCKHVLKVLSVLKTTPIHNVLAKEVQRVREKTNFADEKSRHYLTNKELQATSRVRGITSRTPKEARQALRDFLKTARDELKRAAKDKDTQEKKKQLKPRKPTPKPKPVTPQVEKKIDLSADQYKTLVAGLQSVLGLVKGGLMQRDMALTNIAQTQGMTVAQLEEIIRKENLE